MSDWGALHGLAAQHHRAGRLGDAESVYRQILASQPDDANALYGLGTIALAVNQTAPAIALIGRAVARDPANAVFLMNLGIAHSIAGQGEQAGDAFRRAVAAAPNDAEAHYNFGLHLLQLGSFAEAQDEFRRVIEMQPGNADALMNLGIACARAGALDEALAHLRRCVQIAPDNMEARSNLANVLSETGARDEAERQYAAILARHPDHVATHYNFANLLRDAGRSADAELHYRRAIAGNPRFAAPAINLGTMLKLQRKWGEAEAVFRNALTHVPDDSELHRGLASLEAALGRTDAAAAGYARAIERGGDASVRLQDAVLLPIVCDSVEQIELYRRRIADKLAALVEAPPRIVDPLIVGARPFHLAYHGRDDRPIMETLGGLYRKATPSLNFVARHCEPYAGAAGRKIRVGFVSAYLRDHTIGRLNEKLITGLPRDRFEVTAFSFATDDGATGARIAAGVDRFESLPSDLAIVRARIAAAELDILYFTDIGMEALSYFLGFARLAPVQCVAFGHPVTSGISTIDYFISSDLFETADAQTAFGERLVRFKGNTVALPDLRRERQGGPGSPLFCGQSLFKFHPEFDPLIGAILMRCPDAELIVIEGEAPDWTRRLAERWRRTIPQVTDRIRAIPRCTPAEFIDRLASARVSLDTPHFCGGMTSYESMAVGTPVVTLPGAFTRGRITLGYYRHMGLPDLIAAHGDDYVEHAVRLARDDAYWRETSARIGAALPKLIDDPAPIDEHVAFFEQAVADAARR